VGFISYDDDIRSIGELGVDLASLDAEFLDQGEDISMILLEEPFEVLGA